MYLSMEYYTAKSLMLIVTATIGLLDECNIVLHGCNMYARSAFMLQPLIEGQPAPIKLTQI